MPEVGGTLPSDALGDRDINWTASDEYPWHISYCVWISIDEENAPRRDEIRRPTSVREFAGATP
jgi:hypothetical protein